VETRPNPYKIPPRTIVIEADEEVPVNHRENFLFFFMGALCAAVVGLSLYEAQIIELLLPGRSPASISAPRDIVIENSDLHPYENLPSLY
jgi:hypothetical protein